jgi:polyhydroxyalkanoate synthesis regulator protein
MSEKSQTLSPEMWKQFMTMQSPLLQGMMGNYVEQSQNMFVQINNGSLAPNDAL